MPNERDKYLTDPCAQQVSMMRRIVTYACSAAAAALLTAKFKVRK